MRNDFPQILTGNPSRMIVDTRGSSIATVRTMEDMSEEELEEISRQHGMPINRNPKPRPIQESKTARHMWSRG